MMETHGCPMPHRSFCHKPLVHQQPQPSTSSVTDATQCIYKNVMSTAMATIKYQLLWSCWELGAAWYSKICAIRQHWRRIKMIQNDGDIDLATPHTCRELLLKWLVEVCATILCADEFNVVSQVALQLEIGQRCTKPRKASQYFPVVAANCGQAKSLVPSGSSKAQSWELMRFVTALGFSDPAEAR